MKHHIFRVERCSAVGVYRIMSAALDLYRTSFPPGFIRNGNDFCVISKKMPTFAQSIINKIVARLARREQDRHTCLIGLCRAAANFRASECNFRASESRAELVRAMPSAAENVKK